LKKTRYNFRYSEINFGNARKMNKIQKALRYGISPCFLALFLSFTLLQTTWALKKPAPEAGQIGYIVGKLLSKEHYLQKPLDDSISKQFLTLYLDQLDYNHLVFLQSDIQEFQKYATVLDDEILKANVQPGFDIYNRFLERFEEKVQWVKELVKEDYVFDEDENMLLDRREAPWPANEAESRQLWKQRVKFEILQERLNKKKPSEIPEIITKRYDRLLKNHSDEDSETILQEYLTAMARAYDPHSDYLSPSDLKGFEITMQLSLVGIGALLGTDDGYAKILSVVPGGPADLDKRLKANDRIAGVAQGDGPMVDVVDMKLSKTVELIRGAKNSEVRLLVIPANAADPSSRVEIRLKRDEIKLTESEAKARIYDKMDATGKMARLGYIELPSFYADMHGGPNGKSTTADVARLVEKLKEEGVEGIILDLRKNGGGSLGEVISLTGLFIKNGPVVQVKNSGSSVKVHSDDDPSILFDGPMVVMVHHTSASASEIFAAALQDYGRAIIVGEESTYGKGTVQKVEELDRFLLFRRVKGGALKLTTQKFYRVSGGATQYRGVIPDIRLPSVADYLEINEASLKNPLPYDEVEPADYRPVNLTKSFLGEIRNRSLERVMRDPEFAYIREDIELWKSQAETKTISLNEKKRQQEKQESTARSEKRKTERLARKITPPKVVEVTLQSLDSKTAPVAPALTRKVLDDARAALDDPSAEEAGLDDPNVDPELDESLNILTDMIDLSRKPAVIHAGVGESGQ
jgi:carboxyl-terminal processing protease